MSDTQPEPLFHLGYVSTETGDMGTQGMIELMAEARRINTERDITGRYSIVKSRSIRYWKERKPRFGEPLRASKKMSATRRLMSYSMARSRKESLQIGAWAC